MAEFQYYLHQNGEQTGPYTHEDLLRKIAEGVLAPTDFCWRSDSADWLTVADYFPDEGSEVGAASVGAVVVESKSVSSHNAESKEIEKDPATEKKKSKKALWLILLLLLLLLGGLAWFVFWRWSVVNLGPVYKVAVDGAEFSLAEVPAGKYEMGSPDPEKGREGNEPQHEVVFRDKCWLAITEVTQGQWEAVMGSNPSHFKTDDKNLPVERVSWLEAMEFCKKITELERKAGRLPSGYVYRLPTEAEWEYACRAGAGKDFAGKIEAVGWFSENSDKQPHPVMQKQPNAWGFYDMHGNVWEWCYDWYGKYPTGKVVDPMGAASGEYRVVRGGSWYSSAKYCRSANRFRLEQHYKDDPLGFRVALGREIKE